MSVAALMRALAEAGASPEAIAIAVEAVVEARGSGLEERREADRLRQRRRRSRDPSRDADQEESRDEVVEKGSAPQDKKKGLPRTPSKEKTQLPTSQKDSVKRASAFDPVEPFDEFWSLYPHKVEKGAARKAWPKAIEKVDLVTILEGVDRYVAAKPERIPYANPATWLNGERWNDQPKHEGGDQGNRGVPGSFKERDASETKANYAAAYTAPSRNPR